MAIESDKIKVFPSTRRAMADPTYRESRLLSEGSMIDTNNRVLDKTSYVITDDVDSPVSTVMPLEFIIFGYHFTINSVSDILSTIESSLLVDGVNIYAWIEIDTEGGVSELIGQDEDNQYNGITFSTEIPTVPVNDGVIKYLKILTMEDSAFYIPMESTEKYDIKKMGGIIDCGEIL